MKKENLEEKVNSALEFLEIPVDIISDENYYDNISSRLNYAGTRSNPAKYLLFMILMVCGLLSGIYLGNNFNEKNLQTENKQSSGSNENNIYPLEKVILGKDYN